MRLILFFTLTILFISCKKNKEQPSVPLPQVSQIRITNSETSIILGKTLQLKIVHEPSNAAIPAYEWTSSNPNILAVDGNGLVQAKAIGSAMIGVGIKNTNIYISYFIDVIPDLITSITLDKTNIKLSVHQQEKINFSILPLTAGATQVKWSSSNPTVAQVSSSGVVTGLSSGSTVISATSPNGLVTAKANIEVIPEIEYSTSVFNNINNNLLIQLIQYNEQQGKALANELKAGKVAYFVSAESATDETSLSTNHGYYEARYSDLKMPSGDVARIKSNFSLTLFPNTSRMGLLNLDINFFEKSWEIKGTRGKAYTYSYSYNTTLAELKTIIDENIADVRRYVITGSY
jgi:Bacterial Ig-like domain (group 2)